MYYYYTLQAYLKSFKIFREIYGDDITSTENVVLMMFDQNNELNLKSRES